VFQQGDPLLIFSGFYVVRFDYQPALSSPRANASGSVRMSSRLQSLLALAAVVAFHGGAIGFALWTPAPKNQLVLPTIQGILLPAPPAETVQVPSAKEQPPEPTPPEPEKPKPKPKPKPKDPPKPKPPVELPPSEKAISQPQEVIEEAPPPPTAPAAMPATEDNDSLGAPITPPQMDANPLNNPAPAYPVLSRRMKEQGVVLLEILILPDGSVGEIHIKESSGFKRLDETAVKAVKRWRYTPAKRGSTAIEYWYLQPVEFSLN
jgi:protein TonB